jgi:hypothetical protein
MCVALGEGDLKTNKKKFWFGNEPKQDMFGLVSVCFSKQETKYICLLWFVSVFEPISKQLKQTELFRNKLKQLKIFIKIPKYALYQPFSVGLLFVSVQSKHRNSLFRYRSETTETKYFKTNHNKTKTTGKSLNFVKKITKICSISN